MTRAQIRARVNGYAPDDGDPTATAAFERMFERDKKTLKELGVPLQTIHGDGHHDDIRYRIDVAEYELPAIDLTPAELGALAVASHAWDGSVMARHARRGLTKLRGITPSTDPDVLTTPVHLTEPDHALPAIFEALTSRRPVRFTYLAASTGVSAERTVEPWQLLVKDRGWYLRGWDRHRAGGREFRLSRITSGVRVLPGGYEGPAPQLVDPEDTRETATLAIRPGAAPLVRSRGTREGEAEGWEVYAVPILDTVAFAGLIAAHGEDVRVLAPPELRDRVVDKLRGAASATTRGRA